ncbi:MAG: TasA family protein [Candidatus Moranbacteria bacterium]|nr:TasA family protein [Candidatus Moranbacteria bacterium]
MKKIFLSSAIIFAAAAIIIGATGAYFNDTEESNGNTFTAGKLDLIVNVNGETMVSPIFDYDDIKPGDSDLKKFDITVEDNNACGFAEITFQTDTDNDCTEPELKDEPGCVADVDGELNDEMIFTIYDEGGTAITSGKFTEGGIYSLGELVGSQTYKYAVGWNLPSTVNNSVQTDSFSGDLVIDAQQERNQYPDGCPTIGEYNQPGD